MSSTEVPHTPMSGKNNTDEQQRDKQQQPQERVPLMLRIAPIAAEANRVTIHGDYAFEQPKQKAVTVDGIRLLMGQTTGGRELLSEEIRRSGFHEKRSWPRPPSEEQFSSKRPLTVGGGRSDVIAAAARRGATENANIDSNNKQEQQQQERPRTTSGSKNEKYVLPTGILKSEQRRVAQWSKSGVISSPLLLAEADKQRQEQDFAAAAAVSKAKNMDRQHPNSRPGTSSSSTSRRTLSRPGSSTTSASRQRHQSGGAAPSPSSARRPPAPPSAGRGSTAAEGGGSGDAHPAYPSTMLMTAPSVPHPGGATSSSSSTGGGGGGGEASDNEDKSNIAQMMSTSVTKKTKKLSVPRLFQDSVGAASALLYPAAGSDVATSTSESRVANLPPSKVPRQFWITREHAVATQVPSEHGGVKTNFDVCTVPIFPSDKPVSRMELFALARTLDELMDERLGKEGFELLQSSEAALSTFAEDRGVPVVVREQQREAKRRELLLVEMERQEEEQKAQLAARGIEVPDAVKSATKSSSSCLILDSSSQQQSSSLKKNTNPIQTSEEYIKVARSLTDIIDIGMCEVVRHTAASCIERGSLLDQLRGMLIAVVGNMCDRSENDMARMEDLRAAIRDVEAERDAARDEVSQWRKLFFRVNSIGGTSTPGVEAPTEDVPEEYTVSVVTDILDGKRGPSIAANAINNTTAAAAGRRATGATGLGSRRIARSSSVASASSAGSCAGTPTPVGTPTAAASASAVIPGGVDVVQSPEASLAIEASSSSSAAGVSPSSSMVTTSASASTSMMTTAPSPFGQPHRPMKGKRAKTVVLRTTEGDDDDDNDESSSSQRRRRRTEDDEIAQERLLVFGWINDQFEKRAATAKDLAIAAQKHAAVIRRHEQASVTSALGEDSALQDDADALEAELAEQPKSMYMVLVGLLNDLHGAVSAYDNLSDRMQVDSMLLKHPERHVNVAVRRWRRLAQEVGRFRTENGRRIPLENLKVEFAQLPNPSVVDTLFTLVEISSTLAEFSQRLKAAASATCLDRVTEAPLVPPQRPEDPCPLCNRVAPPPASWGASTAATNHSRSNVGPSAASHLDASGAEVVDLFEFSSGTQKPPNASGGTAAASPSDSVAPVTEDLLTQMGLAKFASSTTGDASTVVDTSPPLKIELVINCSCCAGGTLPQRHHHHHQHHRGDLDSSPSATSLGDDEEVMSVDSASLDGSLRRDSSTDVAGRRKRSSAKTRQGARRGGGGGGAGAAATASLSKKEMQELANDLRAAEQNTAEELKQKLRGSAALPGYLRQGSFRLEHDDGVGGDGATRRDNSSSHALDADESLREGLFKKSDTLVLPTAAWQKHTGGGGVGKIRRSASGRIQTMSSSGGGGNNGGGRSSAMGDRGGAGGGGGSQSPPLQQSGGGGGAMGRRGSIRRRGGGGSGGGMSSIALRQASKELAAHRDQFNATTSAAAARSSSSPQQQNQQQQSSRQHLGATTLPSALQPATSGEFGTGFIGMSRTAFPLFADTRCAKLLFIAGMELNTRTEQQQQQALLSAGGGGGKKDDDGKDDDDASKKKGNCWELGELLQNIHECLNFFVERGAGKSKDLGEFIAGAAAQREKLAVAAKPATMFESCIKHEQDERVVNFVEYVVGTTNAIHLRALLSATQKLTGTISLSPDVDPDVPARVSVSKAWLVSDETFDFNDNAIESVKEDLLRNCVPRLSSTDVQIVLDAPDFSSGAVVNALSDRFVPIYFVQSIWRDLLAESQVIFKTDDE